MTASLSVHVFIAGDDQEDRAFADTIVGGLAGLAEVDVVDVCELHRADLSGEHRQMRFSGVSVYVLSPCMVEEDYNRRNLVQAAPLLGSPARRGFFICRGITPEDLKSRYASDAPLQQLFDRTVIGREEDLPRLLQELQHELKHPEVGNRVYLGLFGYLLLVPLSFVSNLLISPLTAIVCLLMPLSLVPVLTGSAPFNEIKHVIGAVLCFYGMGIGLNKLPPFDLWAWLGRRWRFPKDCLSAASKMRPTMSEMYEWVRDGCLSEPSRWTGSAECQPVELACATISWRNRAKLFRCFTLAVAFWLCVPATMVLIRRAPWAIPFAFAGLCLGGVLPVLHRFMWTLTELQLERYKGFDETTLENDEKQCDPMHGLPGADGPGDRLYEIRKATLFHRQRGSKSAERRWGMPRDRIFISYAWAELAGVDLAARLASRLEALQKDVFLDKRAVPELGPWASLVLGGIRQCTHLFVVIDQATPAARTCGLEIRRTLLRWHREVFPAVICVVDPDIAEQLLADEQTPFNIRFMLIACPSITPSEAEDDEILQGLIRQRRRQGLLRDWLAVLFPEIALGVLLMKLFRRPRCPI